MCADPFVERLLEGFAFLSARVQQKQDSEFPRWTQNFFESVAFQEWQDRIDQSLQEIASRANRKK
jgi:hypothetical protein